MTPGEWNQKPVMTTRWWSVLFASACTWLAIGGIVCLLTRIGG